MIALILFVLTACGSNSAMSVEEGATIVGLPNSVDVPADRKGGETPPKIGKNLPGRYLNAFACNFEENPLVVAQRYRAAPGARNERARDLALLKSLGFDREGRDGDLESAGGTIAASPGLTILGLPARFLELNGLIGDANAMYVTTFDAGVTVEQVVRAAGLSLDRERYNKYKVRHYSRRVGRDPFIDVSLSDRGGANAVLLCRVQSTPD